MIRAALLALTLCACARPAPAPIPDPPTPRSNPILGKVAPPAAGESFSFLVGGHLYGQPGIASSMPSPHLVARTAELARGGDAFLVSLGDMCRAFLDLALEPTLYVLEHLEMPVYNAPGNHDYAPPEAYEDRFGPSYGCLAHGSALFVLLNTELERWQIAAEQLEFLRRVAEFATEHDQVRQVFVFAHRVLFAADDPRYRIVFDHHNDVPGYPGTSNFAADVLPLLRELARDKRVVWFSGDVGVEDSMSLFWDRDPRTGITFVATGLGGTPHDCLVRVVVPRDGEVELSVVPLADGIEGPISGHGLERWRARFGEGR